MEREPPKAFMNGAWYRLDESRAILPSTEAEQARSSDVARKQAERLLRRIWQRVFRSRAGQDRLRRS